MTIACREHSNFLKVKVSGTVPRNEGGDGHREDAKAFLDTHTWYGPEVFDRNPTTSFLTATTLIYAIGAGITAAAGTRLALQLIVEKRFKFYSFQ